MLFHFLQKITLKAACAVKAYIRPLVQGLECTVASVGSVVATGYVSGLV